MKVIPIILFLISWAASAQARVQLASPFTTHMVLQRDTKVPIWGTADPGETVTVEFAGQKVTTQAGSDGKWRINLNPMQASTASCPLTVAGSKTDRPIQLDDVLVGEVWLASGQSNMDFSLSKKVKSFAGVTNEEQEIAAANHPLIRMFTGYVSKSYTPQTTVHGEWKVCSPETAPAFSAVAYFFARDLQRVIKVPVGIITEAYGASTAEAWIDRETMAADPKLKPMLDRFDAAVERFKTNPPPAAAALSQNAATTNSAPKARRGKTGPRDPVQDQHNATVLFNGMINPVIPFAIRGVIWYQGESIVDANRGGIALYPRVQAALIADWRRLWGEGDFPFYIVQLAGQDAASNSPRVREAQATVLALNNTGMAVASDIGEAHNVHPKNKQDVGDRLSRIALANVYGVKIEFSGPMYESMNIEGHAIRLKFSHGGGGLVAKGGPPLRGFEIAGADLKFIDAQAEIDHDTVIVSSPQIAAPVAVRYAWVNKPAACNLFNAAALPAPPFRTDVTK